LVALNTLLVDMLLGWPLKVKKRKNEGKKRKKEKKHKCVKEVQQLISFINSFKCNISIKSF
jgi:hypothetical protein